MQKASETLIPVTLELGGKDAFIVCEDVDVPHVWIFLMLTSSLYSLCIRYLWKYLIYVFNFPYVGSSNCN